MNRRGQDKSKTKQKEENRCKDLMLDRKKKFESHFQNQFDGSTKIRKQGF